MCTETHSHVFPIMLCSAGAPFQGQTDILQEVMNEVSGKSFSPQDPDDGICLLLQWGLLTKVSFLICLPKTFSHRDVC